MKGTDAFISYNGVLENESSLPLENSLGLLKSYETSSRPDLASGGFFDGAVNPTIAAGVVAGRAREKENRVESRQVVEKCMVTMQLARPEGVSSKENGANGQQPGQALSGMESLPISTPHSAYIPAPLNQF